MQNGPFNILCISTFFKGENFLRACKADGNNVFLLTLKKLENEDWPWESIDEALYIEEWNDDHVKNGLAYKFRSIRFDRFVALDDFDVERVTALREHFRMPGMGETTGRHFRDKLSMRVQARSKNIAVPDFTDLFNDEKINTFLDTVPAPWLMKPRGEASAAGIKIFHSKEDLWNQLHEMGDDRHRYLVEKFEPGDVYHADSLTFDGKVIFTSVSQYLDTPFEVAHSGGIFRSVIVEKGDDAEKQIKKMNEAVITSFGLKLGASHTEFIRSKASGKYYFLETSSRVGGANIAEMVESSTGVNLWAEWARIETATLKGIKYKLPKLKSAYSGIIVSLSRYEWPDYSTFSQEEIVWRMKKPWHIGMIVRSESREKVLEILDEMAARIASEFHASLPAPESLR